MMRTAILFAASLLLVGCDGVTPPSAYKYRRDQFFAVVPLPMVNADYVPCFRTIDGAPGRLPDAECYNFTDPQRMRGIAITGFEAGSFYPGRTGLPQRGERSDIWVSIDPRLLPGPARSRCGEGCAVYLEFIGRQTAVQGSYGHMGSAHQMVIVDRVLRAEVLE